MGLLRTSRQVTGPPTGSRRFVAGSTEWLGNTSLAPVTAAPLTMACWFKTPTTSYQEAMWVGDASAADQSWSILLGSPTASRVTFRGRQGTPSDAVTTTSFSSDTWSHACAVATSTTSRDVYLNGGGKASSTASEVPSGIDSMAIGMARDSSASGPFNGLIRLPAIWNIALTLSEITDLARGAHPRDIRPQSLVFFAELNAKYGGVRDEVSGLWLTDNNTVGISPSQPPKLRSRKWISHRYRVLPVQAVAASTFKIIPKLAKRVPTGSRKFTDASSHYLSTGTVNHGIGTGDFTIGCWANHTNNTTWQCIWSNGTFAPSMYIRIASNGWGAFWGTTKQFDTILETDGTWYNLVVRRSGTELSGWVDGVKEATTFVVATSMADSTWQIGSESAAGAAHPEGSVAELAAWNAALTPAEIRDYARGTAPVKIRPADQFLRVRLNAKHGKARDEIDGVWFADNNTVGISPSEPPKLRSRKWISHRYRVLPVAADVAATTQLARAKRRIGPVNWSNPVNWRHPLNKGLVAWYLNTPHGRGGTVWRDLTGRHDGTLTTMDPATDWVRAGDRPGGFGALDFDGSNDHVDVGLMGTLSLNLAKTTVSVWVRTSSSAIQTILGTLTTTASRSFYALRFNLDPIAGTNDTGEIQFYLRQNSSKNVGGGVTSDTGISDGNWHHIVATLDYQATIITLYIDGQSQTIAYAAQDNTGSPFQWDRNLWIGDTNIGGSDNPFDGQMDDFRLHTCIWTPQQARNYYDLSRKGYPGILNRTPRRFATVAAAAGGTAMAIFEHYYRTMRNR